MTSTTTIDRSWIASEVVKGIEAERSLATAARARSSAPPDAAFSVLYNEIAAADERHTSIVEKIAARYGHVPSQGPGGGIGKVWGLLKDKVAELGFGAIDQLNLDMTAKAQAIHWHTAWAHVFGAIGDAESQRELNGILVEDRAHLDALQQIFNGLLEQHATGPAPADKS